VNFETVERGFEFLLFVLYHYIT